jgi:ribonuclease BN (tRNA processing enzyme)
MTLRFLGAGGAFSRRYGTTCSLLEVRNGDQWLIDCGRQAPDQISAAGITWHQLRGQIITHVHGDHIFGLEDFALMRFYESQAGMDSVMSGGTRPRYISHSAVQAAVWESLAASLRYVGGAADPRGGTLESYFEVVPCVDFEAPAEHPWRHSERFVTDGLELVTRESEHVPGKPSCSLEFKLSEAADDDKIAWWSGDCTVDGEFLASIEPRTTIFFHDCTFSDYPGQVHGAFRLLAELPERVRRKVVLMHHEDDVESHRAMMVAKGFRVALPGDQYDLVTGQKL